MCACCSLVPAMLVLHCPALTRSSSRRRRRFFPVHWQPFSSSPSCPSTLSGLCTLSCSCVRVTVCTEADVSQTRRILFHALLCCRVVRRLMHAVARVSQGKALLLPDVRLFSLPSAIQSFSPSSLCHMGLNSCVSSLAPGLSLSLFASKFVMNCDSV